MQQKLPKTFLIIQRLVCISIVVLLWAGPILAQPYQLRLALDTERQRITGFGASDAWRCQFVGKNWPEAKRNKMAEWLFSQDYDAQGNPKGIGLSIWRFYIGAGTTEQGEASGIANEWRRAESFLDENGQYNWSKQQGQQWFLRQAKAYGVAHTLAFSISAPTFMTLNGKGHNAQGKSTLNLKPNQYEAYAAFMANVLQHFKEQNLAFDYLSPINEPQWDWEKATQEGTPATNAQIYQLAKLLDEQLTHRGLETKIVVPESGSLKYLYQTADRPGRGEQAQAFFASDSPYHLAQNASVLKAVLGHSYFTTWPVSQLIATRQALHQTLQNLETPYWQSEFCILEKSDDIGSGHQRDLGMNTALYVARVIHADLTIANAQSWQWWTALTNADFKDGLIYLDTGVPGQLFDLKQMKHDGDFHDSKLLWALGNYARFVRPGMVRIETGLTPEIPLEAQYEGLMASAYKEESNHEVVIVLINYSNDSNSVNLNHKGIKWNKMYVTSAQENLRYHPLGKNTVDLAARSVTTIIGKYEP